MSAILEAPGVELKVNSLDEPRFPPHAIACDLGARSGNPDRVQGDVLEVQIEDELTNTPVEHLL